MRPQDTCLFKKLVHRPGRVQTLPLAAVAAEAALLIKPDRPGWKVRLCLTQSRPPLVKCRFAAAGSSELWITEDNPFPASS